MMGARFILILPGDVKSTIVKPKSKTSAQERRSSLPRSHESEPSRANVGQENEQFGQEQLKIESTVDYFGLNSFSLFRLDSVLIAIEPRFKDR